MDVLVKPGASTDPRVALCTHVTGSSRAAAATLATASALAVDPLDYCARSLGLGDEVTHSRAASWAGLPFAPEVPRGLESAAGHLSIAQLSRARAVQMPIDGVERTYFAPHFADLVALRERRALAEAKGIILTTPQAIRRTLVEANAAALLTEARQCLVRHWPQASASLDLSKTLRIGFVVLLLLVVLFTALAPLLARPVLLGFLLVVIVAPALLRLVATAATPDDPPDPQLSDAALPRYSILVPLRDEAGMVPQLHDALTALDYPPEKLDILFLVESKSPETVAAVAALQHDARVELIVIPPGPPQTKPKALDFALPLVTGEHLVVYDAEDIPDRDQLRRAAARFAAHPELDCLQAELVIDNGAENWLTALFAGEYAGLFGLLLPFLSRHGLPLPLGGTSNHFRTAALRELGGWDAFNVTEDADLGVRLARRRLRTGTLRSATAEEAPIRLSAWMRQRTRWIKGWMQTYLVHNRHPIALLKDLGWRNFLFFQLYVGSLIVSSLIHTVFALSLGLVIAQHGLGWPRLADGWDLLYLLVLVVGYGGAFGLALRGLWRQGQIELAAYQLLLPVYWLLHAVAAVRAAIELLIRPYFWSKTQHGQTRMVRVHRQ